MSGLAVVRIPGQVNVVEGLVANVDVVLTGGASVQTSDATSIYYAVPTRTDRAIIDWERSDDGGASWRVVARSYQDEANSAQPRSDFHGATGASATVSWPRPPTRVRSCASMPATHRRRVPRLPASQARSTYINVLQQSAQPTIADSPRSVLVRTGQTANFSATASGLPAPTLQWQTRPANSNGAWSNVTTGTGATTANYTTAATTLADNGVQYRVVATNAVGSAASSLATVSVSDLDVAPTHHDAAGRA